MGTIVSLLDESFWEGFTVLSREHAYFCYAAVMVPTAKLADPERFWLSNRARLLAAYQLATDFQIKGEFKSININKLNFQASLGRKPLARKNDPVKA